MNFYIICLEKPSISLKVGNEISAKSYYNLYI